MFTHKRNINLEEIKTFPILETEVFKNSCWQQILLLVITIICSIVLMLYTSLFLKDDSILTIIMCLSPIAIGVLFGCQYTPEIPIYLYIVKMLKKEEIIYNYSSTEDLLQSQGYIDRYINDKCRDKEMIAKRKKQRDKSLIIIVMLVVVLLLSTIIGITALNASKAKKSNQFNIDNIIVE